MVTVRGPLPEPVAIVELLPTQITVGMREVEEKRKQLRAQSAAKIGTSLGRHTIPVIRGPKGRLYVIDRHHLSLALHQEGSKDILVNVVANLGALSTNAFWMVLDHRGWVYPYDAEGRRRAFDEIPRSVADLQDDPFRSLAGALRRAGRFAKGKKPFSEFLWADFLRQRMDRKLLDGDFSAAFKQALDLLEGLEARELPGWRAPPIETLVE